jgi:hypothetical protein
MTVSSSGRLHFRRATLLLAALAALAGPAAARPPAASPPMGWNSWDAYGFTLDEAAFRANVKVLAGLRPYGWTYAVIDEGWYMQDPFGDRLETRRYLLDAWGRLTPTNSFPSSAGGAGFRPLADWVHAQGLKFGLHIVRGIPRQAVRENLPIAGSAFHAADAADTADTCPWDEGNYGVRDTPAGQAWYDSLLRLYAGWGVDFLKVDCIADHPYKAAEIRQIAEAIGRSGRPIVLSLSPGPTNLSHAAEVSRLAQMWRIGDDTWDGWRFEHPSGGEFPNGVADAFDHLTGWSPWAGPGHWPDADMLPFGSLAPHPGWGEARASRLSHDEARTQLTLWAIARSPLILGGDLTRLDPFTRSQITNREVLQVNQRATDSRPVTDLPAGFEHVRVWAAREGRDEVLALFNLDEAPVTLRASWTQLGVKAGRRRVRDLWGGRELPASDGIDLVLPAHGSALYRVE